MNKIICKVLGLSLLMWSHANAATARSFAQTPLPVNMSLPSGASTADNQLQEIMFLNNIYYSGIKVTSLPSHQPFPTVMSISNFPSPIPYPSTTYISNWPSSQVVHLDNPSTTIAVSNFPFAFIVTNSVVSTATITSTTVATTSVQIAAANTNRHGLIIFNNKASPVFVNYGPNATTTGSSITIDNNLVYTHQAWGMYTGALTAIRTSGTGTVTVTEL